MAATISSLNLWIAGSLSHLTSLTSGRYNKIDLRADHAEGVGLVDDLIVVHLVLSSFASKL